MLKDTGSSFGKTTQSRIFLETPFHNRGAQLEKARDESTDLTKGTDSVKPEVEDLNIRFGTFSVRSELR